MQDAELEKYRRVQNIAKETIAHLNSFIQEGVSEADIVHECGKVMKERGVSSFWYHGVVANVLIGTRTTLSISGREYVPSNVRVQQNDLVTVDLSPAIDNYWGDFARSFVVVNNKVTTVSSPDYPKQIQELFEGLNIENVLHEKLQEIARPSMTFEGLYVQMNQIIEELGYVNLDFRGNLGHSIERHIDDRIYIERGNTRKLHETSLFTFEPHIKRKDDLFGYKREDIYFFSKGKLKIL